MHTQLETNLEAYTVDNRNRRSKSVVLCHITSVLATTTNRCHEYLICIYKL